MQGSWQRSFTIEGILATVLHNMIDVESTVVVTATGALPCLALGCLRDPEDCTGYVCHGYRRVVTNDYYYNDL
jgi:hypothetical protein